MFSSHLMYGLFGREPTSCSVTNTTWSEPESACELSFVSMQRQKWLSVFSQRGSFCLVREEMRWGWGELKEGGTLKEMALHCDVQTTGCDM